MKVVYIAHNISGDIPANLNKIRAIVRHINLTMPNVVPFVPYFSDVMALHDDIPEEREKGIKNNIHLLESGIVDELWVYSHSLSTGVTEEIKLAEKLNIPVIIKQPLNERP